MSGLVCCLLVHLASLLQLSSKSKSVFYTQAFVVNKIQTSWMISPPPRVLFSIPWSKLSLLSCVICFSTNVWDLTNVLFNKWSLPPHPECFSECFLYISPIINSTLCINSEHCSHYSHFILCGIYFTVRKWVMYFSSFPMPVLYYSSTFLLSASLNLIPSSPPSTSYD